jgi:hypothetical protein
MTDSILCSQKRNFGLEFLDRMRNDPQALDAREILGRGLGLRNRARRVAVV